MTKKTDTPAIRFKGFSDTWEQRKLNEVGVVIDPHPSHRAPKEEQGGIPFIGIGDVDEMGNINRESARPVPENVYDEHHKRYDLNVPSLGLGRVASLGKVIRLRSDIGKYAISPTISVLQFSENINIDYLYAYMNTPQFKKQFEGKSNGSTRQSVGTEMVRLLNLSMPFNLDEQKAIGTFYKNLDNLITLHQREYEKLHNIKKSMLEKMFPKNGSNVPEIRFKGFTEAWEQRKLGELGTITTGNTPSTSIPDYYSDDGIVWVTPTDICENITFESARKLSDLGQQVGRVVPKNTILVTCIASIGKNTMLGNTGSFNQQINGLTPNENKYDPYFLLTESALWSAKMKGSAASGTMQIVNRTEFSELKTWLPSLIEQQAIGAFFKQLDNLITLHQRELEKLQNIKKSMLEKMFV